MKKGEHKKYKPIEAGDSYGLQFICSHCTDFPKVESLTIDMKYCFNCGVLLDWSDWSRKNEAKNE